MANLKTSQVTVQKVQAHKSLKQTSTQRLWTHCFHIACSFSGCFYQESLKVRCISSTCWIIWEQVHVLNGWAACRAVILDPAVTPTLRQKLPSAGLSIAHCASTPETPSRPAFFCIPKGSGKPGWEWVRLVAAGPLLQHLFPDCRTEGVSHSLQSEITCLYLMKSPPWLVGFPAASLCWGQLPPISYSFEKVLAGQPIVSL